MKIAVQAAEIRGIIGRFYRARSKEPVADWCERELRFDEPNCHGPFSLSGREYIAGPLNDWGDPSITDIVLVFGSQTGKTSLLMGAAAWMLVNEPSRCLWVMPTITLAESFSETRWLPMLRVSMITAGLLPMGSLRHAIKKAQQQLGGSIVNFVGSNSPANLASVPARVVILDEIDKFDQSGRHDEADAVNLADQRTKKFANPKRIKTSTPTIPEGLIWREALKGDIRRRFIPCPKCGKFVVLNWSPTFSTLPRTGAEAFVRWDAQAKRNDGSWDLDRVERSARAECPHCQAHINDAQKIISDRRGYWAPTLKTGDPAFVSYQLSSLYGSGPETRFGRLALKFLHQAKTSMEGLQGFINGDLAEPYAGQDTLKQRTELVRGAVADSTEWKKLLTVDCQASTPHFWYVVRAWKDGNSEAITAGPLDTWEEIRTVQTGNAIQDCAVLVDSGFGARSDADVYRNCARFGEIAANAQTGRGLCLGWMPAKGMPGRKRWVEPESKLSLPYYLRGIDPFVGTSDAGRAEMSLFEFSGDFFKDILESLRQQKGGFSWTVRPEVATEDYWRHLEAETKTAVYNRMTGRTQHVWKLRSQSWPNHLLDCEVMQVAFANFLGLFEFEENVEAATR